MAEGEGFALVAERCSALARPTDLPGSIGFGAGFATGKPVQIPFA